MSEALIIPRDIASRLTVECCRTCRYSHKDETGDMNCRRNPPQATILLTPAPPPRTGMVPAPFSTFPIVRPDFWCGNWETRRDS